MTEQEYKDKLSEKDELIAKMQAEKSQLMQKVAYERGALHAEMERIRFDEVMHEPAGWIKGIWDADLPDSLTTLCDLVGSEVNRIINKSIKDNGYSKEQRDYIYAPMLILLLKRVENTIYHQTYNSGDGFFKGFDFKEHLDRKHIIQDRINTRR